MVISDRACDYCFAYCVILLISFQLWYGTPHVSFSEDLEEMSKSYLYVGSSSIPAGWTIYMCSEERTNHMSYDIAVIDSSKVRTRTIFGNASRMSIPIINKLPSGGILSYVLSKSQMENLASNSQIDQIYVEPLMHCLEPVRSCSRTNKLVQDDIQCLTIANPNNFEVNVEFTVNFYVTNVNEDELDENLQQLDSNDDGLLTDTEKNIGQDQQASKINTKSKLLVDTVKSVFLVVLSSGITVN
ncbi:15593_t:CDS:2 [Funneliformis mosseae]|uniref:15593_t:CDS:1 n=1 Tax=Funneliformis mosseae TaxID=27381 RepID=A0A9N8ZI85_FUNMO|nr:15593_t:CDS:2 [Funneliformis mosseae]